MHCGSIRRDGCKGLISTRSRIFKRGNRKATTAGGLGGGAEPRGVKLRTKVNTFVSLQGEGSSTNAAQHAHYHSASHSTNIYCCYGLTKPAMYSSSQCLWLLQVKREYASLPRATTNGVLTIESTLMTATLFTLSLNITLFRSMNRRTEMIMKALTNRILSKTGRGGTSYIFFPCILSMLRT